MLRDRGVPVFPQLYRFLAEDQLLARPVNIVPELLLLSYFVGALLGWL